MILFEFDLFKSATIIMMTCIRSLQMSSQYMHTDSGCACVVGVWAGWQTSLKFAELLSLVYLVGGFCMCRSVISLFSLGLRIQFADVSPNNHHLWATMSTWITDTENAKNNAIQRVSSARGSVQSTRIPANKKNIFNTNKKHMHILW